MPGGSGRNGEKWQDLGCVLKVGSTKFTNDLDVGYERKRRVKADCRNFGLSDCKDGAVALDVETGGLSEELGSFLSHRKIWLISSFMCHPRSQLGCCLEFPWKIRSDVSNFHYLFFTYGH